VSSKRAAWACASGLLVLSAAAPGAMAAQTTPPPATPAQPAPSAPAEPSAPAAPAATPAAAAPAPAAAAPAAPLRFGQADPVAVSARALARIAMIDARVPTAVTPEDFGSAALLLEIASDLAPADADILRLAIEARDQAGDAGAAPAVAAMRRRLLALQPDDTVLTLGIISDRISALQDADSRIAALENLIGPRGESIDSSVRSRLALDAAMLHREKGDASAFADRLRLALSLDGTNKEAAALLHAFVAGGDASAPQRLESLLVLLYADPLDPATHQSIGRELSAGGALTQAKRFFEHARLLTDQFGGTRDSVIESELDLLTWRTEGPAAVANKIGSSLRNARADLARNLEEAKKGGADPASLPKPEDVRLPVELERLWAMAADAAGDAEGVAAALVELAESVRRAEEGAANPSRRPEGMTDDEAKAGAAKRRSEFVAAALLTGIKADEAAPVVTRMLETDGLSPAAARTLEGWVSLRNGVTSAAREKFELARGESPAAELGLALLAEQAGDKAAAAQGYRTVAEGWPSAPIGAWAASAFSRVIGEPLPPREEAASLSAMAAGVPRWVDEFLRDPGRVVRLSVSPNAETLGPLDRLGITVKVRNTSPAALAVGAERAVNSRLLVAPSIEIGANPMGSAMPNVFSLDRRLRLMPGEEFRMELWPEAGFSGWLMDLGLGQIVRANYRVIMGFRPREGGGFAAGPFGLSAETGNVVRRPIAGASASIDSIIQAVASASSNELPEVLGLVRFRLYRDHRGLERITTAQRAALVEALAARYAAGSPAERTLILVLLPHGRFIASLAALDERLAAVQESDDRVAAVRLITRAHAADDPALAAAEGTPGLSARAAQIMKARLAEPDRRCYSRMSTAAAPRTEDVQPTDEKGKAGEPGAKGVDVPTPVRP
jgi:hypothetical protein